MSRFRRHRWQHTHGISAAEIPGLVMAWHYSALANLSAGAAVASYPDISGNARDGSQSTAGFRPLYQLNQVNGKPAPVFDGTDDSIEQSGLPTLFTGSDKALTVVAVLKLVALPNPASQAEVWAFGAAANNTPRHQGNLTDQSYRTFRRDDANVPVTLVSGLGLTNTNPHIVVWTFTGTSATCHVDGVSVLSGAQDVGTVTLNTFSSGCLSSNGVRSGFANMALPELNVYNRAITDAERRLLEAALSQEYRIAVT